MDIRVRHGQRVGRHIARHAAGQLHAPPVAAALHQAHPHALIIAAQRHACHRHVHQRRVAVQDRPPGHVHLAERRLHRQGEGAPVDLRHIPGEGEVAEEALAGAAVEGILFKKDRVAHFALPHRVDQPAAIAERKGEASLGEPGLLRVHRQIGVLEIHHDLALARMVIIQIRRNPGRERRAEGDAPRALRLFRAQEAHAAALPRVLPRLTDERHDGSFAQIRRGGHFACDILRRVQPDEGRQLQCVGQLVHRDDGSRACGGIIHITTEALRAQAEERQAVRRHGGRGVPVHRVGASQLRQGQLLRHGRQCSPVDPAQQPVSRGDDAHPRRILRHHPHRRAAQQQPGDPAVLRIQGRGGFMDNIPVRRVQQGKRLLPGGGQGAVLREVHPAVPDGAGRGEDRTGAKDHITCVLHRGSFRILRRRRPLLIIGSVLHTEPDAAGGHRVAGVIPAIGGVAEQIQPFHIDCADDAALRRVVERCAHAGEKLRKAGERVDKWPLHPIRPTERLLRTQQQGVRSDPAGDVAVRDADLHHAALSRQHGHRRADAVFRQQARSSGVGVQGLYVHTHNAVLVGHQRNISLPVQRQGGPVEGADVTVDDAFAVQEAQQIHEQAVLREYEKKVIASPEAEEPPHAVLLQADDPVHPHRAAILVGQALRMGEVEEEELPFRHAVVDERPGRQGRRGGAEPADLRSDVAGKDAPFRRVLGEHGRLLAHPAKEGVGDSGEVKIGKRVVADVVDHRLAALQDRQSVDMLRHGRQGKQQKQTNNKQRNTFHHGQNLLSWKYSANINASALHSVSLFLHL